MPKPRVALAVAALLTLARAAGALPLDFVGPASPSFWSSANWSPPTAPSASDVVTLDNALANPFLFLGDTGSAAAQNGEVAQLRLMQGNFSLSWESSVPQANAQPGSLQFLGANPADPGVRIRVGGAGQLAQLRLLSAATDPARAAAVVVGPGGDPSSLSRLILSGPNPVPPNPGLPGHPGHFYATTVSLLGDFSLLDIVGDQQVSATRVEAGNAFAPTFGTSVRVANGARLNAGTLLLDGIVGDALTVDAATVSADLLLTARGTGNDARVVVAQGGSLLGGLDASALNGARLTLDLSGAGTLVNPMDTRISADAASTALVNVSSGAVLGGQLSLELTRVDLRVDAAQMGTDQLRLFGGSARVEAGSSLRATNALIDGSDVSVASAGSAFSFYTILAPNQSHVLLDGAGAAGTAGWGGIGFGVSSDLLLSRPTPTGPVLQTGGDLLGAGAASLDVLNGSSLELLPALGILPAFLAIGSTGAVSLDPTSRIVLGFQSPAIPAADGKITLGLDSQLWGTGSINGVGFTSGTHLDVLNQGGLVHPGFSPGRLTIDGSYTQEDGVLEFSIGGSTPVTGFSQLAASAGISITGGTIRFVREAGYNGDLGAVLTFLLGPNGVVDVLPGVAIDDQTGLGLAFDFATGSARITQLVPEPAVLALLLGGFAGLAWIGSKQRGSSKRGAQSRVRGTRDERIHSSPAADGHPIGEKPSARAVTSCIANERDRLTPVRRTGPAECGAARSRDVMSQVLQSASERRFSGRFARAAFSTPSARARCGFPGMDAGGISHRR